MSSTSAESQVIPISSNDLNTFLDWLSGVSGQICDESILDSKETLPPIQYVFRHAKYRGTIVELRIMYNGVDMIVHLLKTHGEFNSDTWNCTLVLQITDSVTKQNLLQFVQRFKENYISLPTILNRFRV